MASKLNRTEFIEIINASMERTWDILYHQYGEIHVHNPTMVTSHYLDSGTKGELNAVRHCKFSDKLYLNEKIIQSDGKSSFKIEVIDHNLPFVKEMSAIYELTSLGEQKTQLKMTSFNSFSPDFMKYMMKGQLAKSLLKHLFGFKYYAETGDIVRPDNYDEVYKNYA